MPQLIDAVNQMNVDKVTQLLTDKDLKINATDGRDGNTALHVAAMKTVKSTEMATMVHIVKLILADPRVDVNATNLYDNTALIDAAMYKNIAILNTLLADPRVDVNVKGHHGNTALMMATLYGHAEVVNLLTYSMT